MSAEPNGPQTIQEAPPAAPTIARMSVQWNMQSGTIQFEIPQDVVQRNMLFVELAKQVFKPPQHAGGGILLPG